MPAVPPDRIEEYEYQQRREDEKKKDGGLGGLLTLAMPLLAQGGGWLYNKLRGNGGETRNKAGERASKSTRQYGQDLRDSMQPRLDQGFDRGTYWDQSSRNHSKNFYEAMGDFTPQGFDTRIPEISRDWRGMTEQDIAASQQGRAEELARLRARNADVEGQYMNTDNYLNTATGPEAQAAQRQLQEQIAQIENNPNIPAAQKARLIQQVRSQASSGYLTQRQGANAQRLEALTGLRAGQEAQGMSYLEQLLGQRQSGRESLGEEDTRNMQARQTAGQLRAQQAQMLNSSMLEKLGLMQKDLSGERELGADYYGKALGGQNDLYNTLTNLWRISSDESNPQWGRAAPKDNSALWGAIGQLGASYMNSRSS